MEKFKFSDSDAREFAEFLCPILDFAAEKRPTAQQCLQHPWLNVNLTYNEMTSEPSVEKLDAGLGSLQLKPRK